MIKRTQIILEHGDLFKAIKDHIGRQDGMSAGDVCNFHISFENDKPVVTVNLSDKKVENSGL
ncbi:hypothetical protein Ab1vBOLIVR2_gp41 [Agrobacterium phage OLIVR2]|uniref:Uncharacterized protein n=1 Tax=Agrobacterium phage OLIVR1 TaxID=2723769 RepID=A0A858MR36_9CAUD|nr:hypothetical protein KNU98_gp068 [Agrobacterium phage OLIVR1]QIW87236.1 hypothetical protein Ab1vBOLIVR1_gp41 [Agrobacterium phage OLIVR1]QIW87344.1 hypothetical protein Ab1vBOLIVR2_gp41 [Agrobacterium phage OLIVR2]QIW87451.1 hypothetical protein Ab1vBOLIVR3_gp41 [Agrobacterium phage OLIVR3]